MLHHMCVNLVITLKYVFVFYDLIKNQTSFNVYAILYVLESGLNL